MRNTFVATAALVAGLTSFGSMAAEVSTKAVPAGMLIDATGKKIGHYTPVDTFFGMVLVALDGRPIFMGVTLDPSRGPGHFPHNIEDHNYTYFQSTDCTGEPFVFGGHFATTLRHGENSWFAYVPGAGQHRAVYQSKSHGPGNCDSNSTGESWLSPVAAQIDLSTLFTTPYSLR